MFGAGCCGVSPRIGPILRCCMSEGNQPRERRIDASLRGHEGRRVEQADVAKMMAGPAVVNIGLELFAETLQRAGRPVEMVAWRPPPDRKSTRLNSSHGSISYAVFCLKKK